MLKQYNHSSIKQRGVVLVLSLIFLVILTLIGISSAKTSVLQEKIARHSGLKQAAFQAADSCANHVFNDEEIFTLTETLTDLYNGDKQYLVTDSISNRSGYTVEEMSTGTTSPPRGTGYSAVKFQAAHNEYRCQGFTESSSVNVTIHQGIFQVFPKL